MKLYYITFRSVTYGQRAEKLLSREQYRCSLQRTPRWMEEQGCGYALRVWTADVTAAVALLREHKVQMRRVYFQRPDGLLEEISV